MNSLSSDILVIDDEESICYAFRRFFAARGRSTATAATAAAGLELARRQQPFLIFLDVCLPDGNGLDLLEPLAQAAPAARIVVITAYGSLDTVLKALDGKAFDYLVKPLDLDRAWAVVGQAEAARDAAAGESAGVAAAAPEAHGFVGCSPAIQEVFKQIGRVARADAGVLILGETGTGKELVARTLHRLSPRRDGPFVAVNCGALPENLVESELFGHVRGAFTGAAADRTGRFEQADGGILFLDEIGDLPHAAQVKLLRFLDSRQVERVGGTATLTPDVRVLAATNHDLARAVAAGHFRADLFYRLHVIQITLPPLRERREDIPLLARHFLRRLAGTGPEPVLAPSTVELLTAGNWPGNVRELRNALEQAWLAAGGGPLLPEHFSASVRSPQTAAAAADSAAFPTAWLQQMTAAPDQAWYDRVMNTVERELLKTALARADGNQSAAATLLGLHRNTLARKLQEHHLMPDASE